MELTVLPHWVSSITVLTFAFAFPGDVVPQFSTMVAGFLGLCPAYVHGLSLSSVCSCCCWCWVWENIVRVLLWRNICGLSRWYRSSNMESIFP